MTKLEDRRGTRSTRTRGAKPGTVDSSPSIGSNERVRSSGKKREELSSAHKR